MFLSVDGGYFQIYNSDTSYGARCRCFLLLMMDAPRSIALAPLREPTIDVSKH
jgi:hypothetical protein